MSGWGKFFLAVQTLVSIACIRLLIRLPPPGWAVAILAFVAAAMSVHGRMKDWQRGVWISLIGVLLIIELRAIGKDRIDNAELQTKFFQTQQQGFSEINTQAQTNFRSTADRLHVAIDSLRKTLAQTAPRALFGKPSIDFGHVQISPGSQFHYNLTMINAGNDTAQDVDTFSRIYIGKPDDSFTQQRLMAKFEQEWMHHKRLKPASLPPGSPDLVTDYSPRFTLQDVKDIVSAARTIYILSRTSYSDKTGTWYSDSCQNIQVPIQPAGILTHPCPIATLFRYKPKRP